MNRKRNVFSFKSYTVAVKIFFAIATFLVLVFVVAGQFVAPDERDTMHSDYQEFKAQWQQIMEDGSRVPVDVPGQIPAEWGEVITLVTTVPDDVTDGDSIFFHPIWQDVTIYIDGELREYYNTEDSRPFGTNSAFRYVFIELSKEDAGKELCYQFSSNSKYAGIMRTSYIGEKMSVWMNLISESGIRTVIAVFLFLMSLFCIIVCAVLKWIYKKTLSLNYLAWTIFLAALWMLSEVEFRQLLVRNVSILTSCTYWTLMLIPFPLILFIDEIQNNRYKKLYVLPIGYSIVLFMVGTLLQVFDVMQFVEMLPYNHAGIVIAIICIITTITIDLFGKKIYDYLAVGIGVYGMLLTAVLEMVLYYTGSPLSLGTVLAVGLLFLLVMAIIKTGQDLFRSEQKKQQAIMAREAQAKFLANMSHEIRTPINSVIGMNEMILRESENDTILEYAHNIQSASNMLLGLVNDILDFTKIESGQLELVEDTYSLETLIRDELLLLNARVAGKPISTQVDIDPYIPVKFLGDELRIKQILTNLLSNAVKYTMEGSVTLKVFFKWIDAEHVELCFSVIDTGVGIKQEDLSELFDSFKRFELDKNRNIEGTGLGLNIAKQLVESMQGSITVESEYGKGTTFTICIPQKIMDKQPVGDLGAILKKADKKKQTAKQLFTAPEANVMIVDDNSMNLSVIKGLLKRTQIRITLAKSGKECLELTKHKKYNIILMDHMMPELDGVETLHLLRADASNVNQSTTVIALTANAIAGCREMYLGYGFNDYISKPIQTDKLEELLTQYLPKALVHRTENLSEAMDREDGIEQIAFKKNEVPLELLQMDHELGMSYCFDSEEMYHDILEAFIEQIQEYLELLEKYYTAENWKDYRGIAHALKGNALNVGASNFSKLSLQHELAAKEENIDFIKDNYPNYIAALKALGETVEGLLK